MELFDWNSIDVIVWDPYFDVRMYDVRPVLGEFYILFGVRLWFDRLVGYCFWPSFGASGAYVGLSGLPNAAVVVVV